MDVARKRIALRMKLDAAPARPSGDRNDRRAQNSRDSRGGANAYQPK